MIWCLMSKNSILGGLEYCCIQIVLYIYIFLRKFLNSLSIFFFENKNLFQDFSLKWFLCEGCLKMKF